MNEEITRDILKIIKEKVGKKDLLFKIYGNEEVTIVESQKFESNNKYAEAQTVTSVIVKYGDKYFVTTSTRTEFPDFLFIDDEIFKGNWTKEEGWSINEN